MDQLELPGHATKSAVGAAGGGAAERAVTHCAWIFCKPRAMLVPCRSRRVLVTGRKGRRASHRGGSGSGSAAQQLVMREKPLSLRRFRSAASRFECSTHSSSHVPDCPQATMLRVRVCSRGPARLACAAHSPVHSLLLLLLLRDMDAGVDMSDRRRPGSDRRLFTLKRPRILLSTFFAPHPTTTRRRSRSARPPPRPPRTKLRDPETVNLVR